MDVFTLLGTIAINNESANKAITDTTKMAGIATKDMGRAFEKIGSAAVKCGKIIASGLTAGAAAMGALLKSSIGEYAEYEQLVGGIETLFKDSKRRVMDYANQAYKTAGLSANEYMSTVTGFSASLLQGLNGDTEKAAELANMAIEDMSDNANKMGTSMKSIQDAYQGFAKQNYTLLDNLKLGYGGTQEEMARLINNSGVLGKAITVTAETVNQVPFNKIIEAIHVVQTEMEITGTTAKESSSTISGSFASFKATWRNFLTGLANEDADMSALYNNMTEAGQIVLDNVTSVLPTIKENILIALEELAQDVDEGMRTTVWPKIQELFKFKLDVELPDYDTFVTEATEWWNGAKEFLETTFTWTMKISGFFDMTSEDEAALQAWGKKAAVALWKGIVAAFSEQGNLIENVTEYAQENPENTMRFIKNLDFADRFMNFFNPRYRMSTAAGDLAAHISGMFTPETETELQNELDETELTVDVKVNPITRWFRNLFTRDGSGYGDSFGADGSHASGLERVPFDGYRAILHRDEAVLTAGEAKLWRGEQSQNGQLASMVAAAVRDAVAGIQFNVSLDSGALVGQLAPRMDMQLGTLASRKGRG